MEIKTVLRRAIKLYEKYGWTKNNYVVDKKGNCLSSVSDKEAAKFCMVGILKKSIDSDIYPIDVANYLTDSLRDFRRTRKEFIPSSIIIFNDSLEKHVGKRTIVKFLKFALNRLNEEKKTNKQKTL